MANYSVLKAAVEAVVKTNGNQEITGANLQTIILSIIDSLGAGYQFMGVATPSTTPPSSPDYNIAYIGGAGTYDNFGSSVTILPSEIGVFKWNGSWTSQKIQTSLVYDAQVETLGTYIAKLVSEATEMSESSIVSGAFINRDGTLGNNSAFSIYKYNIEQGKIYTFSGSHSSAVTIPFLSWADANGNVISVEVTEYASVYYRDRAVVPPAGAAQAWLNVQNSSSSYNFKSIGDASGVVMTKGVLPSGDLNDVVDAGLYLLTQANTYENAPKPIGFLRVSKFVTWVLQEFYVFNGAQLYKRKFQQGSSTIEAWQYVGGGGNTNEYTFNEYQQTVNLTATPVITTDTNNYLASTGDTTDRTAAILAMLQSTGTCHLGAGVFYVDSLIMPDNTSLIGCGTATEVYLVDGTDKFTIRLGSNCIVKDMYLIGSTAAGTPSIEGTRVGILWQGNYTQTQSSTGQPQYGTIDNVRISKFDNSGIRCYDTGYGTSNYISVTNCHITYCYKGINIEYWSEFHKFTNVRCAYCYYGCINNGGNNIFVNCDFSSSQYVAFLIDNSQGQSPNSAHGSCVGCVFNHTANNAGVGIMVLGEEAGFVFDGCQIFFSQINISNSDGITFSSCNFGVNNCDITITNGGAMLFVNNLHQGLPTIIITNNSNVHFVNCYVRSTGAEVKPN